MVSGYNCVCICLEKKDNDKQTHREQLRDLTGVVRKRFISLCFKWLAMPSMATNENAISFKILDVSPS